jgi:uridine phosphorylase
MVPLYLTEDILRRVNKKILDTYEHLNYLPVFDKDGKPGLTLVDPSKIGDYVIMTVRDPLCAYTDDPALEIAKKMDNYELAGKSGIFLTYTGEYKGAKISVVSSGSGAPEAELALIEFMRCSKANTFVRIGGAGAWNEDVHPGDIVIASGAVRDDGMTQSYICPQFPAVANYEVVTALIQAAESIDYPFHVGVIRSADSDFCGWGKPAVDGYIQPEHTEIIDYYNRAGVLCADRESSASIFLPQLFGRRGGSIVSIGDNVVSREGFSNGAGHQQAIEIGLNGIAILNQMDKAKKTANKKYWYPGLGLG